MGLNSLPWDQESHFPPTEPARHPLGLAFKPELEAGLFFPGLILSLCKTLPCAPMFSGFGGIPLWLLGSRPIVGLCGHRTLFCQSFQVILFLASGSFFTSCAECAFGILNWILRKGPPEVSTILSPCSSLFLLLALQTWAHLISQIFASVHSAWRDCWALPGFPVPLHSSLETFSSNLGSLQGSAHLLPIF